MTIVMSILLHLIGDGIVHTLNSLPTRVSDYHDNNLYLQLAWNHFEHQERQKDHARRDAEWKARMDAFWQQQAELNAQDRELRRKAERAKNPGG